jgi:hypothetical protein
LCSTYQKGTCAEILGLSRDFENPASRSRESDGAF